ncbi:MAG: hypothetical protein WBP12_05105 [Candidatus Saccharimonas sp.]
MTDYVRGDRIRSIVDDGFVSLGQLGTVTHGDCIPPVEGAEVVRVNWDNHTSSQVPKDSIELLVPLVAGARI